MHVKNILGVNNIYELTENQLKELQEYAQKNATRIR